MDIVEPEIRSRMMSAVRRSDTKIELRIRKALHALGFRYRTDVPGLPGRPDIVLRKYGAVVFVHGCFWHGHDCRLFRMPATRTEFWAAKLDANRERDQAAVHDLRKLGWRVALVWECSIRDAADVQISRVISVLTAWLATTKPHLQIRGD